MNLALATTTHTGGGAPSTPFSIPIPLNTNLLCRPWFAQAVVFGDVTSDGVLDLDPAFSSAATGQVGAQD